MFSIILGLSPSHALSGLASLTRTRNVVTTYGPQGIWTTTLVLMHFLLWWSIWDFRAVSWNFPRFLVASAEPLILFFMTALLVPSVSGSETERVADFSLDEIGEILEIAPATAKTRVHRGRVHLRRALDDQGVVAPLPHGEICDRCAALFRSLDLAQDACETLRDGAFPVRLMWRLDALLAAR